MTHHDLLVARESQDAVRRRLFLNRDQAACDVCHTISWDGEQTAAKCGYCALWQRYLRAAAEQVGPC